MVAAAAAAAAALFTIAVVGSACDAPNDVDALLAQWNLGNYYVVGGSGRVIPPKVTTVAQGIRARVNQESLARGAGVNVEVVESLTDDVDAAVAAMNANGGVNTVVVACAGAITTEGEDRASLSLDQEDFLVEISAAASAAAVPLVATLLCPGPVLTPFRFNTSAILAIFLGGQHTGTAVASVLFGDTMPSAKLPVTFPDKEEDVVAPCAGPSDAPYPCPYSEGLFVGYRQLDAQNKAVAFPFGHGLSFADFEYTANNDKNKNENKNGDEGDAFLVVTEVAVEVNVALAATVGAATKKKEDTVQPSSATMVAEVVQVYVGYPAAAEEPPKVLKAFQQVLVPTDGSTSSATLTIPFTDLTVWSNAVWGFVQAPGTYTFYVGSSSRDIRLQATMDLF
mmetsp:Transcript_154/g.346  ORF Transcript_154/g.346 Transcript_154/m.346 type:complete len:395 (+) Transcript_154:80-1264(+)